MNLHNLAPGFALDSDEEWMIYLPLDKQRYLREKRSQYISLIDDLSTLKSDHARYMDENKARFNAEQRRKENKKYEQKRKSLTDKQQALVERILPKIQALKKEALELKRRRIEEDSASLAKRRRVEPDENLLVDMEDVELVPDDYLPTSMPTVGGGPSPAPARDNTPMDFTNLNSSPSKSKSHNKELDSYIAGLEPDDAKILVSLRSLIETYKCRDRVLKAIYSIRSRDNSIKKLDLLQKAISNEAKKKQQHRL